MMAIKGAVPSRKPTPPDRAVRFGVSMPPIKAQIIDVIVRAGESGITAEDICRALYPGDVRRGEATIKAHISVINQLFVECDTRIRCRDGHYRLVNVQGDAA
jgi:hypothetical protein